MDARTDGTGGDGGVETPDAGVDALPDAPDVDAPDVDAAIDAADLDAATDAADLDAGDDAAAVDDAAIDAADLDAATDAAELDAGDDASDVDAAAADATTDAADVDAADVDAAIDATPDASVPQTFYWADWTTATPGAPGSAAGTFAPPSGVVAFTYAGAVAFAQTSGGTNYWVPGAPYINAVTANAPPLADIIALSGSAVVNTVTFDPPVTGLVMGVVSLGAPGTTVRYDFDRPIVLLSYGAGYWGNGILAIEGTDVLTGTEGHGAIQFPGTVSSLSWMVLGSEYWHGFTLGIPAQ